MRLVIAECTVDYNGRLTAHLPRATRLVMVKADGCVAMHADGGAYKPLNWMNAPNLLVTTTITWTVTSPKGETADHHDARRAVATADRTGARPGAPEGWRRSPPAGTARGRARRLEPGLRLIRREYPTDVGPVDLLCRDSNGNTVAIEIKRRGEIDGVEH